MSEMIETTGVETTAAAEQEITTEGATETTETTLTETEQTGETVPAAGGEEKVEKAFAARLAKERQKIESETAQKARDAYIAEQGYIWNGKPIVTEAEYKQALYEKELQDKGIDPKEVEQKVLDHPDVKEARELKKKLEAENKQRGEYADFVNSYPDVKPADIPKEVWTEQAKGVPLKYAYADYALRQMKAEEAIAKANEANAKSSTGSVNSNGNTAESEITQEVFETRRGDRDWLSKNLSRVTNSKWYKQRYNIQ